MPLDQGPVSIPYSTASAVGGTNSHPRYLPIESMRWACQIPRYYEAFGRAVGSGRNIARIVVARMLSRSLFKMLRDGVRFNQVRAA